MDFALARNWWVLVLRGVLGIVFGVLAFIWPGITWFVLTLFFGAYVLVDGVFAIVAAATGHREARNWWSLVIEGIVGIFVGLVTFFSPGITALSLLYLIGFWAVVTGVFEIVAAIRLRRHIEGEWALALAGILSVVFGVLILLAPLAGLLAVVALIAAYAIVFGVLLIVVGLRLHRHAGERFLPGGPSDFAAGI